MKNSYSIKYSFNRTLCFNNFYILFKYFWFSYVDTNLTNRRMFLLTVKAYSEQNFIVLAENLTLYTSDLEQALTIFKEILQNNKTCFEVEEINFIFSFNSDTSSVDYKYFSCNTNSRSHTNINILIIILINLILNIIITLGLLHFLEIINIYDLFNISTYYYIDCEDLNDNVLYNYNYDYNYNHKIYKPKNPSYFQPTLDLFKYKTPSLVENDSKSEIIKTLNNFYDMNSHIIKDNNSLIEQVNKLKPYYNNYNDLKFFIINNNPLIQH